MLFISTGYIDTISVLNWGRGSKKGCAGVSFLGVPKSHSENADIAQATVDNENATGLTDSPTQESRLSRRSETPQLALHYFVIFTPMFQRLRCRILDSRCHNPLIVTVK